MLERDSVYNISTASTSGPPLSILFNVICSKIFVIDVLWPFLKNSSISGSFGIKFTFVNGAYGEYCPSLYLHL